MKTVLIVEDDYQIAAPVKEYLESNGYRAIWSSTGYEALEDVEIHDIDIILLDIMMPDLDGYGFLEKLRMSSDIPVIIISAKIAVADKVKGFDLGADDYITKPFSLTELKARIEYHLKKKKKVYETEKMKFIGGLEYNTANNEFKINGEKIVLTSKESDILSLLIKNEGKVISKKDIYEIVWAEENTEGNNTITVHIKSIREKLKEDLKSPIYIETVWGKGYKFIGARE
ncbi:MAG: response regulator transcription factor [Tissierellia bacterium]|nr:response regulator transcription factor [Tissierellia bacterium]